MATLLLIIIYISFIGLGLPDSLLGTAWPEMYVNLNIPISFEAVGNSIIILGTIISSMNAAKLIKKLGTYRIVLFSTLLTACAIVGFGFVPNFYFFLFIGIPLGLGAGAVDTALNNYLAIHYKASQMNWLHCFWGLGAMAGPIVMSSFIHNKMGWRYGYFVIGALQMVIVILLLISRPVWKLQKETNTAEETVVMKFFDLVKVKGVKLAMLTFLCYCATEYTIVCWGSTYLVKSREVTSAVAAGWLSVYYLGITGGRMLCGFIALKVNNRTLIRTGLFTVLLGALILILPLPSFAAFIGLAFIGFGCSPVFPGMITETPKRFGNHLSQSVIGLEMTSASTGILIIPTLFGFLSERINISFLPFLLAALVIIILISTTLLNKINYKED